jgi:hypothetical protein
MVDRKELNMENINEIENEMQDKLPEQKPVLKRKKRTVKKRKTRTIRKTQLMEPKLDTIKIKVNSRKKRVPLGVPRARLAVNERDGYVRRWINDRDDRISRAQQGGYNFVKASDAEFVDSDICNSDAVCKVVNSDGTKAYLMEISKEYYEEDRLEKKKAIDLTEEALKVGVDNHGAPGRDGRYIPRECIKITN